ncbi:nucleoside kinase [Candidatus Leptofilum sp.]|uniref:nucleoside kinase n=1 Tax=Candidatus Leptofilum sp. TaxID=3241576 RepID=UPI003B5B5B6D
MFNVCDNCGSYRPDKEIQQSPARAICPDCQHAHHFVQQPLFVICGPSGGGKTAVCRHLQQQTNAFIPLEADILLRPEFNNPDKKGDFQETWLRVCKNVGQAGKPVALFHSGGLPQNIEPCVERRYFSTIHYLALIATDATIAARLEARPAWRGCTPAFIDDQVAYNQWFRREGMHRTPPITTLDTTQATVIETSNQVLRWVRFDFTKPET